MILIIIDRHVVHSTLSSAPNARAFSFQLATCNLLLAATDDLWRHCLSLLPRPHPHLHPPSLEPTLGNASLLRLVFVFLSLSLSSFSPSLNLIHRCLTSKCPIYWLFLLYRQFASEVVFSNQ